ncbi:substrate-binding domain-containing protein [Roseateles saccharophilus]|uniref:Molybdate transport system substrate-binding protein n=1 Tax=Roseateles saccharophilus TaxID=304 RepID=A0A4R3UX26_ROSSA|nr:substrate-binding domain-containing protein [Roseateles saccharophilus]MDG0832727.1 ABC transporter substrate-binding protein [Roseateles saccharophilus]TCU95337.1 molybdate transport system substrate-binding protein [Roseateles saccharophilus]
MSTALTLISSMATRHLLTALAEAHAGGGAPATRIESVGGVDAARRVQEGEAFDLVVLAADAIARLDAAGRLKPGSIRPIADSSVAIAVRAGAARPDVATEAALRAAVLQARAIGYSTGPSGTALMQLFERWGLADTLKERLVQARPGVPVGSLVASGEVELGFQQLSELQGLDGITLLSGMPPEVDIVSRFSGAVTANAAQPDAAQALLDFMAGPAADALKRRHGMHAVQASR